jgi:hypothetical protein
MEKVKPHCSPGTDLASPIQLGWQPEGETGEGSAPWRRAAALPILQ